jgi:endo-alpha-1,4-polygalactosaminidase (GH114 family)
VDAVKCKPAGLLTHYHSSLVVRNANMHPLRSVRLLVYITSLALLLQCMRITLAAGWFVPPGGRVSWQYQLSDDDKDAIKVYPGVEIYMIDIDSARKFIPYIKKKGIAANASVVCYFSAGTFETFRDEFDRDRGPYSFSKESWVSSGNNIGKAMDGWPGEYWVDIRSRDVRRVAKRRMQFAKEIGCSGVDPDNVDAYSFSREDTGFKITKEDGVNFVRYLADTAHELGLGFGLKNALEILPRVANLSDWFTNESCFTFKECAEYVRVAGNSKSVFIVEYCDAKKELGERTQDPACFCGLSQQQSMFNTLIKRADLGSARLPCDVFCRKHADACGKYTSSSLNISCRLKKNKGDVCYYLHE